MATPLRCGDDGKWQKMVIEDVDKCVDKSCKAEMKDLQEGEDGKLAYFSYRATCNGDVPALRGWDDPVPDDWSCDNNLPGGAPGYRQKCDRNGRHIWKCDGKEWAEPRLCYGNVSTAVISLQRAPDNASLSLTQSRLVHRSAKRRLANGRTL